MTLLKRVFYLPGFAWKVCAVGREHGAKDARLFLLKKVKKNRLNNFGTVLYNNITKYMKCISTEEKN